MIEIIKQKVDMPPIEERRYQYTKNVSKYGWRVEDKEDDNKVVYRSKHLIMTLIAWHNLNKKHYLNLFNHTNTLNNANTKRATAQVTDQVFRPKKGHIA